LLNLYFVSGDPEGKWATGLLLVRAPRRRRREEEEEERDNTIERFYPEEELGGFLKYMHDGQWMGL
jgi:hypothetical protein